MTQKASRVCEEMRSRHDMTLSLRSMHNSKSSRCSSSATHRDVGPPRARLSPTSSHITTMEPLCGELACGGHGWC